MQVRTSILYLTLALLTVAGFGVPWGGAEPDPRNTIPCADPRGCPDLVVDPDTMDPSASRKKNFKENSCHVQEGMVPAGERTVVYFTFTTPNFGDGDLIVGRPEDRPDSFEFSSCHGHFHFKEYADYRVWTPDAFATWDALRDANPALTAEEVLAANPGLTFAKGEKRGFCVIDIILYTPPNPPKYALCEFQGISVGWADEYYDGLDGQFVDVTGLASGTYILEAEVNAERVYEEMDYTNNRAQVPITI
ncbi:MAG: hypothetical protein HYT80_11400 [Euryarchaeota archaeon]|nr:hypothetical protein [Euryarchaeota archaeon]